MTESRRRGIECQDCQHAAVAPHGITQDITERKAMEEALRRHAQQLEAVRQIGLELTRELDIEVLLNSIVVRATELLDSPVGGLYLYRPERQALELVVFSGLDQGMAGTYLNPGEGLAGKVWETGEPLFVENYCCWDGRSGVYGDYSFRAVVGVPLQWRGELLGVLDVAAREPGAFDRQDAELLALLAAQATVAIENARLFHEEQQRRLEAEALRQASLALSATLDRDRVLERLLLEISRVVPYDDARLWWLEGDIARVIYRRSVADPVAVAVDPALPVSLNAAPRLQWMAESQRPCIISDTSRDSRWHQPRDERWIRSWAGAPIVVRGDVVAFFSLSSHVPGSYSDRHAALLDAFASHAAVAVENARLYTLAQTAYDELHQAQSHLVHSARLAAVGELAAGVAHELNNPLTSVLGFAELAMQGLGDDDPRRDDLAVVAAEARRAREIVRNLLDFAREVKPQRMPVDLNATLKQTVDLVRARLTKKRISIHEEYAPDLPWPAIDPAQIRQVCLNLITNAAQAMPDGGALTLRTGASDGEVYVQVEDEGVGIARDDLVRIFEPFYTTKEKGTGLGLSVSQGIVDAHDGRIEVESCLGEGSAFTVWLPLGICTDDWTRAER